MAVPVTNISLEDVRSELNLAPPVSLSECIASAGKTGTWNKLSDFAGYSLVIASISALPESFILSKDPNFNKFSTITSSSSWEVDLSTKPSWITINNSIGVSGENLVFSVPKNLADERSATLKVMLSVDNSIYVEISIIQFGEFAG